MSNILLTGSNGYLGSVLLSRIDRDSNFIFPVDIGIFSPRYNFTKLDLKTSEYKELFSGYINTIVHLAGISNDPSGEIDPDFTYKNNVEASKRLIDFAVIAGVKRFVFASSASVYGENDDLVTEGSPLNPKTHYAKSKALVEEYLLGATELNPIIFRFGTLFGISPKMRFDLAVNLMVKDAMTTGKINVYGGGDQYRPFLNVRDAADNILKVCNLGFGSFSGEIFNLSTANIRIISLAEAIAGITGAKVVMHSTDHPDMRNYRMDTSKYNSVVMPSLTSLYDGIVDVMHWVETHLDEPDNRDYYTLEAWKEYLKNENSVLKT